jgi:hypothetical protein
MAIPSIPWKNPVATGTSSRVLFDNIPFNSIKRETRRGNWRNGNNKPGFLNMHCHWYYFAGGITGN